MCILQIRRANCIWCRSQSHPASAAAETCTSDDDTWCLLVNRGPTFYQIFLQKSSMHAVMRCQSDTEKKLSLNLLNNSRDYICIGMAFKFQIIKRLNVLYFERKSLAYRDWIARGPIGHLNGTFSGVCHFLALERNLISMPQRVSIDWCDGAA